MKALAPSLSQRGGERLAYERGVLRAWDVVEVLHGRLDVGVAHPLLDTADVGGADHAGAECVAEIVEAERPERCSLEGGSVALRQR